MQLTQGTKVGRYVIGERLGMGGMGVVYAARDPDLDRDVAIKVLRSEFARSNPDAAQRIAREAQAMARISHPNVVNVHDVGTLGDQVFVAMERINGGNLRAWLRATPRTVAEILEMFVAAGRGLIAAHDAGIVHRDFKPDNVLVGNDGRARVTDFGLAYDHRVEDLELSESSFEGATRPIVGTPSYMAPEQHAGGNADPRTDQFSFAVALYEALYGKRPFSGSTRDELADSVMNGRVDAAPSSRVPSSLRSLLLRAMSTKPGDRFATMADLLRALGRDRGRRPRRIAIGALMMFALVTVGFVSDSILRERTRAVTRESFTSARTQLDRLLALRTDTFVAQSDSLYRLPAMQEIVGTHDLADFGLGDEAGDRERLERVHENFRSADWLALARTRKGDLLAIADQKGRLIFDTASPNTWGNDIAAIPAIASAYDARNEDAYLGVLNDDDPTVIKSGLLGDQPSPRMFVMFARTKRIGDQPRALFVLLLDASRLLEDVGVGEGTRLSVVAPDGRAEGTVPPSLVPRVSDAGISEVALDGETWLVERTPLGAKGQTAIAQLVLARQSGSGLSGLFPYARETLLTLGFLSLALALGGSLLARSRDLKRLR
ncbi:MAG: serine/threonine protein kinase [Deltaproteobacteria bacterium]|nr:serine/threonine protein kinase [Deltaproteobacteria bacterium]